MPEYLHNAGGESSSFTEAMDGDAGAEIEQAFIDTLYGAFAQDRKPGMVDITTAMALTAG